MHGSAETSNYCIRRFDSLSYMVLANMNHIVYFEQFTYIQFMKCTSAQQSSDQDVLHKKLQLESAGDADDSRIRFTDEYENRLL